jgi:uncharacterized peroxidase-related enzyme
MPRINPVTNDQTDASTQATLAAVKGKIGMVPNLFSTFAQAPAVLNANLAFSDALATGRLTAAQREIVALATAQINECHYCLSAHTLLGKGAGLSPAQIAGARGGKADNAFDNALAMLAANIVQTRGQISNDDLASARAAGLDDGHIVEVIGNVAHNILTNYTNNVAQTDIDFPVVELAIAA